MIPKESKAVNSKLKHCIDSEEKDGKSEAEESREAEQYMVTWNSAVLPKQRIVSQNWRKPSSR